MKNSAASTNTAAMEKQKPSLDEFLAPTWLKIALFLALLLLAIPTTRFQVNFPCIEGQGCPSTEPVLLPLALSLLYSVMLSSGVGAGIKFDFPPLALGALLSYIIACALAYAYGKYAGIKHD